MSSQKLTKNQLRRQRLQKKTLNNTDFNYQNNTNSKTDFDYESKLAEIKTEIQNLENNNIKIPKTGKNGQLELTYTPEVIIKINNLKKQLQEIKKTKYQNIKKDISNNENEMFNTARKEMQDITSNMNEFTSNMNEFTTNTIQNSNIAAEDTKDLLNTKVDKPKRRNSTNSILSDKSNNSSIKSYESTSTAESTNISKQTISDTKNNFSDKMPSEKEVINAATKMWDVVKNYVKQNPKFRELQDKQKLEIFRDKLGFAKFMEEFPIVSRYMVCMGQFKLKAFQRLLDKMKRTKYPPPEERDKKYMEDQWIKWQADYVQYLWEEYQKRHYNTAERQWVWQETYKRLKGEFDDFRKMHEDIEEKVKQEKKTLSGKNARDLLERLKTGTQKLKAEDEEQLLQSLLDISFKKNYKNTMQQLLKNIESTEDKYEFQNNVFNVLMPCCGRLVKYETLKLLLKDIVFNNPVSPLAYVQYNGEIKSQCIKCPACNGNIRNVDINMYKPYNAIYRGIGNGENIDNQPKVSMIETVDADRMNEIPDYYKNKELKGMEPILEDVEDVENINTDCGENINTDYAENSTVDNSNNIKNGEELKQ